MAKEERSLWEQLDSDVEPWRRGRVVLVSIAAFYLLLQAAVLSMSLLLGNLEYLMAFAASCILFWVFFYLIWIGTNWTRVVAGGWLGLNGFAYLIWSWRDENAAMFGFGVINLVIGTYFCLSPSVYFFARRQRENRSWFYSGLVIAALLMLSVSFFVGAAGLFGHRLWVERSAVEFANEAAQRIYGEYDQVWLRRHSTEEALARPEGKGLLATIEDATDFMGRVSQITAATGEVRVAYHFPVTFSAEARMVADGKSQYGHARLYFLIVDSGDGWKLHWTWWEHPGTPMPGAAAAEISPAVHN